MYVSHFIYSSVDGNLDCLHLLAVMNNDIMNVGIQVHVWVPVFNSFLYMPSRKTAGSYNNSMFRLLSGIHVPSDKCKNLTPTSRLWYAAPTCTYSSLGNMQKSWPNRQDHSWSGPYLPFPSHLPPLLCSNLGESVWFPDGRTTACASSAPYFSSFAYSCLKKLFKPFWTLSGLQQHPLCTKSTKIHHSKLFRRIKSTLASISSHTLASTNPRLYKSSRKSENKNNDIKFQGQMDYNESSKGSFIDLVH